MGRALRHRNYRLFFAGQSISLIGTWLKCRARLNRKACWRTRAPPW
jgi:hypothetical protein